jgi:hypothetical protein
MKALIGRIFPKPIAKTYLELDWNDEALSLPARSITFNQLHIGVGVRVGDLPTIYSQLIQRQFGVIHLLALSGQSDRFRQVAMVAGHKEGPHGTSEEKCAAFEKSITRELRLESFSIDEVHDVHSRWCLGGPDHLPFAPAFSYLAFSQAYEVMPLGGYHAETLPPRYSQ